ncbi:MAG TPA: hypothetical protein VFA98_11185 [Thermoanaerobaculia bacterium]|jgi:hypothetical protein|nr:hypothetical protein [Thermoanaerobaculia bacterium]
MNEFHDKFWREPDWLSDGDDVWLPVGETEPSGKTRVIKCRVSIAAGDHARIVNEARGIHHWMPLRALLVGPEDPHHPNQREATLEAIAKTLAEAEGP